MEDCVFSLPRCIHGICRRAGLVTHTVQILSLLPSFLGIHLLSFPLFSEPVSPPHIHLITLFWAIHSLDTFWLLPCCFGLCSCLYRSDRPLPNARRHATWQLLSLALHLSLCEAAVKPVWEVKRKQFNCQEATLTFCYIKSHILCRLFTYTCHSGW